MRDHRQLKSAHGASTHWVEALPLVLLSIRTAVKSDLQCSVAELVYGTTLRLPGEFFEKEALHTVMDPAALVRDLRDVMRNLKAPPVRPQPQRNVHVSRYLAECTHVFVRHDGIRKPLQPTYDGPYRVIERAEKFFTIDYNGRNDTVSLDRLKPAYLESEPQQVPSPPLPAGTTRVTRSGRRVHFPDRLAYAIP